MDFEVSSAFLERVVTENARQAIASPGDLRLAVNAIMTLDAFFGHLHAELLEAKITDVKSDSQWKEERAVENQLYRVCRDAAYALKHGRLDGRQPRLVRKPENIITMPAAFDAAAFDRSAFDTETVWIDCIDNDYRADEVIEDVLEFARDQLARWTQ